MANFSKLCITDAGKRLLNLKLNAGDELSFVEMVMSERKYDMAVLEELTGLEGIRQRADIRKETRADDTIVVNAVFLNSGLEEGTLRTRWDCMPVWEKRSLCCLPWRWSRQPQLICLPSHRP